MGENEKHNIYQQKLREIEVDDKPVDNLRYFHLTTENIFDNLKSSKSARDFKWLFILLFSLLSISTAIHIGVRGIGINIIPLILMLGYWVYYRYQLKIVIAEQAIENKKILGESNSNPGNKKKLSNRIQYIINGIDVLDTRVKLIRNQYVIFFPILTILFVDIIKGPLKLNALIVTTVIAIILGGIFWIYYFKNDLIDLQNAEEELEVLAKDLNQL